MMDLGGGPGTICLSFVAEHKTMKGVVLDQKEVASEARKIISEYGFEDRVTAQAGDYIKDDDLGKGFDFVWSSATLNLAKGHLVQVFRKIYNALSPGGIFASYHPAIWGNGQDDWEMVVSFAPYQMLGIDMQLYEDEIPDAMIKAGFHTVKSKNVRNFFGNQRLDIARKPK
jgi:SAM-dependent methyltransferase